MKETLTIIDDFFASPESIREFALSHDFNQKPEYDGHVYEHFAPVKDDRFLRWLEAVMSARIGAQVQIKLGTFTCLKDGNTSPQWIHSDDICASHAAVFYLFDGSGHGTSFWRHRELNAHCLQDIKGSAELLPGKLFADGQDRDAWELTDVADSRFNRLIFYPSSRFHSRTQKYGFGNSPENARLTLAVFFDLV